VNHASDAEKKMKRLPLILACATAVLASSLAFSSDWNAQPLSVKRQMASQMISCMKKRMYGDRLISYNEAAKRCRDEVQGQLEKATSGPLVADSGPAASSGRAK
jgi:hypothetical protein